MKIKQIFVLILAIFLISFSYAQTSFSFEKKPIRTTLVSEFKNIPLIYKLNITSYIPGTNEYRFFSLLDLMIFPQQDRFNFSESKEINLTIYVNKRSPGVYNYQYFIKNPEEIFADTILFKIVKASDAFSFQIPKEISREDKELEIKIKNNLDVDFDKLWIEIKNSFINEKKDFKIKAYEEKVIKFRINENIKNEYAGEKILFIIISSDEKGDNNYMWEEKIILKEYENIVSEEKISTIFIGKKIYVKKINLGNKDSEAVIAIQLNPFEKFFFKANINADEIRKEKGDYVYIFKKTLKPNESIEIIGNVNYAWIIILILIIIIAAILYFILSKEDVIFEKEVRKVKTKTGTFALKVNLTVKNKTKQTIRDVSILDYLPLSMRFYEYGLTLPDQIEGNKLYWKLGDILPNDQKTITYLCYSKIKYEGTIELPSAKLKYLDKKGKNIIFSNKASISISKEDIE